jgi:hypothetical protein
MCFSASASFSASGILTVAGAYCVRKAAQKDRDYLLFAAVPLIFGIQQFSEGFVWLGLGWGNHLLTVFASHFFLFFAFGFWPFYAPLSVYFAEKEIINKVTKRFLFFLTAVGLAIGAAAYTPLLTGSLKLTTEVVGHSIAYATGRPEIIKHLYVAFYLLAVIPPFLISSDVKLKIFGYLLIFSVILAEIINQAAFDSVWCFFAAFLSLFIVYIMLTLPHYKREAT